MDFLMWHDITTRSMRQTLRVQDLRTGSDLSPGAPCDPARGRALTSDLPPGSPCDPARGRALTSLPEPHVTRLEDGL
ncbi:unnamed protein product [Arctogadus glacialis]